MRKHTAIGTGARDFYEMQAEVETMIHRADLVDLASFDGHMVAELFSQRLNAKDIPTHAYDERDLQLFVFLSEPKAYMKIQVAEEHYAKAVAELIQFETTHPEFAELIFSCPDCGSFAVEYPQYTRKFITPLLVEWLSNFGLFKKLFYCRKCHYTWAKRRGAGINRHHINPADTIFVPPPG